MPAINWDIRREGRAWDDEERVLLLGLLLENLGADVAVRLGDPAVWKAAVASLG